MKVLKSKDETDANNIGGHNHKSDSAQAKNQRSAQKQQQQRDSMKIINEKMTASDQVMYLEIHLIFAHVNLKHII